MATILALDKDELHLAMLASVLKHDRHQFVGVSDSEDAFTILRSKVIDLIIVEPLGQRQDRDSLCREIGQISPDVPLVVLSERSEEEHIICSLQTSADDYITKPFSPHQLLARIQALLRRSSRRLERRQEEILAIDEIELNLIQMHVIVHGKRVPLTPRELWLLHALMSNAGRVLSRDQLLRLAWGEQFIGVSKTVDVCIQRIRKKIAPHLNGGGCIEAFRGFGYSFHIDQGVGALRAEAPTPAGMSPALVLATA
ncbi:MAG: response regulator transcription factor [Candidatus Dormibacteraeota bacterium]|nr:response regulator transcription factor [Candidatus Dormibacteraeota bacterium]